MSKRESVPGHSQAWPLHDLGVFMAHFLPRGGEVGRLFAILACVVLAVSVTLSYVPFMPLMPVASLDPSWAMGMNELSARQAVFGQEVMFTFGPLASVYTTFYHPKTDFAMLWVSGWLALSSIGLWWLILRGRSPWMMLLVAAACSLGMRSRDALMFAVPTLTAMATAFHVLEKPPRAASTAGAGDSFAVAVLACSWASLGLMPLVKGTMMVMAIGLGGMSVLFLVAHARHRLAMFVLVAPPAVSVLAWTGSGQPLHALPDYLAAMSEIFRGYTEAMASERLDVRETALIGGFCAVSAALLYCAWLHGRRHGQAAALYFPAVMGFCLFLTFKAAFVRLDNAHLITAMGMLVLCGGVTLVRFSPPGIVRLCWGAPLLLGLALTNTSVAAHVSRYLDKWWGHQSQNLLALDARLRRPEWLTKEFDQAMARIRFRHPLPALPGSMDVYSTNQATVLAHGLDWNPRPVLQSYSVYTPALVAHNRAHLLGRSAPDWLWFRVEPIDDRLPSTEDGGSWAVLLRDFRPVQSLSGGVALRRVQAGELAPVLHGVGPRRTVRIGEWLELPEHHRPLMFSAEIHPNLLGRLAGTLFRLPSLSMDVRTTDGTVRSYRVVSGMLVEPVIISPLVENTADFVGLYQQQDRLSSKKVQAIRVRTSADGGHFWHSGYSIGFGSPAQ